MCVCVWVYLFLCVKAPLQKVWKKLFWIHFKWQNEWLVPFFFLTFLRGEMINESKKISLGLENDVVCVLCYVVHSILPLQNSGSPLWVHVATVWCKFSLNETLQWCPALVQTLMRVWSQTWPVQARWQQLTAPKLYLKPHLDGIYCSREGWVIWKLHTLIFIPSRVPIYMTFLPCSASVIVPNAFFSTLVHPHIG